MGYARGTGKEMKTAVIAPSMLYLLYPLNGTVEGYSREKFVEDLVDEVGLCSGKADFGGVVVAETGSVRKTSVAALRQGRRGCLLTSLKVCVPYAIDSSQLTDSKAASLPKMTHATPGLVLPSSKSL